MFISNVKPYGINNNFKPKVQNSTATRPVEPGCDTVSFGNTQYSSAFYDILSAIGEKNTEKVKSILNSQDEETKQKILQNGILIDAAWRGYTKTAKVLLDAADEETKQKMLLQSNDSGKNAFMYAVGEGKIKTAIVLLNAADKETKYKMLEQTDKYGNTAMTYVDGEVNTKIVKILYSMYGNKKNKKSYSSAN